MKQSSRKFAGLAMAAGVLFASSACAQMPAANTGAAESADASAFASERMEPAKAWEYGAPLLARDITNGGAGGDIIRVTSLASSGPGTLRDALSQSGPRIIVFEVAGVIDLAGDNIAIRDPFVTIAGQTAPSPGVTLVKGGLVISGHDVIVQHLRIRPGDLGEAPRSGRDIDAITTSSAYNVVVDHCSLSWATDENLSASGPRFTGESEADWREGTSHNILFSQNIVAEGLAHSTHAKGEHSKGSLIHDNVSDIVIYANLYTSNYERSPLFKGGVQGAVINNLIYNPGQRAVQYNLQDLEWGDVPPVLGRMDLINNALRAGPSTEEGLPLLMIGGTGNLSVHMSGNQAHDRWGGDLPTLGRYTSNPTEIIETDAPHFSWSGLDVLPTEEVETYVLAHAGARPWDRDVNDVRVLADAAEGRGGIIDSQEEVGGYPDFPQVSQAFDADRWNLETMAPKADSALDAEAGARGT
ncbi:pectate lyase family protein [Henriciella sp.]|uniref:pectate lyase family protein n=1 Tax=Henriciella sp. TaxID=1968823 RepID=UPI003C77F2D1